MKFLKSLPILMFAVALSANAQQLASSFGGIRNALDYAYGYPSPGGTGNLPPALQINGLGGNASTGVASITLVTGAIALPGGGFFYPLAVGTPAIVGTATNRETITPTGVSGCNLNPVVVGQCVVTATFANLHGASEPVTSATFGLQEAINSAEGGGGGMVTVATGWTALGGTNATLTAAVGYPDVYVMDNRGLGLNSLFWSLQPSTLTSLAAPATLTATTAVFSGTSGTWTAASQFLCITYVDALGGEGPCSLTYSVTPAATTSLTITAPVASTGAVGWRAYGGATYNGAYLLPITGTACTLNVIETVLPACAMSSSGVWPAIFVNTTTLRPNAQSPTVNLNLPLPQSHTTFSYAPTGSNPLPFQTNYGPFVAFGSTTSAQIDVVGAVNLPLGYLNQIGRSVRISGKIAATVNTAAIPTITISLGWVAGTTAGAPVAVCADVGAAYGSSAAYNLTFSCTVTTNALGATAATIMTNSVLNYAPAAGGAGVSTIDTGVAAIGSLGLTQQNTVYVSYTSGTNTTSAVQLLDLHVETLQ